MKPIIQADQLSKRYGIGAHRVAYSTLRDTLASAARNPWRAIRRNGTGDDNTIWALKDVSFEVAPGEVVGIIGRNGAGKSTLLKVLSRITEPTKGEAVLYGRIASLLEVGTGFNPELTGRENIFLNGAILGMHRAEIVAKFDEIVSFAEIEPFIDTPVKHYSSGMYLRLGFAVAAHLELEIIVIDEVLAVGDAAFQRKCLGKMQHLSTNQGRTVLFVSHNMQAVKQLCSRALLIEQGVLTYDGTTQNAIARYFGGEGNSSLDLTTVGDASSGAVARILSLGFFDHDDRTARTLGRHQRLRVLVTFELITGVDSLTVSMALIHHDGTPVFSEILSDQEPPRAFTKGIYEVAFEFNLRYLKEEPYFISVYLLDFGTGRSLAHCDSAPLPDIQGSADTDPYIEARRWGVVRIPVSWRSVTPSCAR